MRDKSSSKPDAASVLQAQVPFCRTHPNASAARGAAIASIAISDKKTGSPIETNPIMTPIMKD